MRPSGEASFLPAYAYLLVAPWCRSRQGPVPPAGRGWQPRPGGGEPVFRAVCAALLRLAIAAMHRGGMEPRLWGVRRQPWGVGVVHPGGLCGEELGRGRVFRAEGCSHYPDTHPRFQPPGCDALVATASSEIVTGLRPELLTGAAWSPDDYRTILCAIATSPYAAVAIPILEKELGKLGPLDTTACGPTVRLNSLLEQNCLVPFVRPGGARHSQGCARGGRKAEGCVHAAICCARGGRPDRVRPATRQLSARTSLPSGN